MRPDAKWRARLRGLGLAAPIRLARLNLLARTGAHQDFGDFIAGQRQEWEALLAVGAQGGRRVLIGTNTGGHFALAQIDRMLAVALTLRGARSSMVLCDGVLPACQMCEINLVPDVARFVKEGPPRSLCGFCANPAIRAVEATGLPVHRLSDHLDESDRIQAEQLSRDVPDAALAGHVWRGIPVGEHAMAGALRFFARGDLDDEPEGPAVLRRFFSATLRTAMAYMRLLERERPDVLVAHHGIYVPQGIACAAARAADVRVVTWNPAYRKHCFIFSHGDTYHRTLMDEPTSLWKGEPLDAGETAAIESYLHSRRYGREDWIRFHRDPDETRAGDLEGLGLDPGKPVALALTNVFWDAQLHYPANAFASQREWLVETVRHFAARSDMQLLIRVHPAEMGGSPPSRQHAVDEIKQAFPKLPANVVIVPPDSAISTYGLAEHADCALIFATKTGVELAATGLPVIVAGEAWARGKGFTVDARSPEHYGELLQALPRRARLSAEKRALALAYARHFFFGRMIPLPFVQPAAGVRRFDIAIPSLDRLRRGADPGLDVIMNGILEGTEFVMPRPPA